MNDWKRAFLGIPEDSPQTIGDLLKTMRKEAGFTQEEMGKKVGLKRWTISDIENDVPETIDALTIMVLRKWKTACTGRMSNDTASTYRTVIMKFMKML